MLPFEFTIPGPPVSQQTSNRANLQAWKATVRAQAPARWPAADAPHAEAVQITVTYFHDGPAVRMDNDNLLKPIQDALNNLVYFDDRQITDCNVRKTDLNGRFEVRGMSQTLAEAFSTGKNFCTFGSTHVRTTENCCDACQFKFRTCKLRASR
jgi:crossover junction endodeoxyribonuclease RusA